MQTIVAISGHGVVHSVLAQVLPLLQ